MASTPIRRYADSFGPYDEALAKSALLRDPLRHDSAAHGRWLSVGAGQRSRAGVDTARCHWFALGVVEADPGVRAAADDIRGKCGGH